MRTTLQLCRADGVGLTDIRPAARPHWHELAPRFPGERECLAAYLALEGAEVLGGVKPANLLNLVDRRRPCGRNLHCLWSRHGEELLAAAGLAARELARRADGSLLLIYRPEGLARHVGDSRVANFLRLAGYPQAGKLETVLDELCRRCAQGDFPHEVGALLGYPLKDVAGFMGWVQLPVTAQGPWKIYGDPRPSLAVVAACRGCREFMASRLCQTDNPLACLAGAGRRNVFTGTN